MRVQTHFGSQNEIARARGVEAVGRVKVLPAVGNGLVTDRKHERFRSEPGPAPAVSGCVDAQMSSTCGVLYVCDHAQR
jgi:hypothetical protein